MKLIHLRGEDTISQANMARLQKQWGRTSRGGVGEFYITDGMDFYQRSFLLQYGCRLFILLRRGKPALFLGPYKDDDAQQGEHEFRDLRQISSKLFGSSITIRPKVKKEGKYVHGALSCLERPKFFTLKVPEYLVSMSHCRSSFNFLM